MLVALLCHWHTLKWTHIDSENSYAKKVAQVPPSKDPLENEGSWPHLYKFR